MSNNNVITIRLNDNAILAYNYLKKLKKHPAKLFRQGGEQLVIDMAIKYKFTLKKIRLPF